MFNPSSNLFLSIPHGFIVLDVNLVVLEGVPKALSNDIVQGTSISIHADLYVWFVENIGDIGAGESRILMIIE
jgi:hypothetical protein